MFKRLIICGVGFLVAVARLQADGLREFRQSLTGGTHYSLSGQFLVHDPPVTDFYPVYPQTGSNMVRLDPTLLAISCERIKDALLRELGARDQWRGKIILDLYHAPNPDSGIVVTPMRLGGKWEYRVALPDYLERYRVVSLVVHLAMLEMADRNAESSTELPAWLAEGMTREVALSSQLELVLDKPEQMENGVALKRTFNSTRRTSLLQDGAWGGLPKLAEEQNGDPLSQTLEALRTTPPLGVEELSWPREGQFEGQALDSYRYSAQLFVHELLRLTDGKAGMQAFLPELSRHLNWQIAFLQAFHGDFASQLDLEKWWALRLVQLTGRDLVQAWSNEESWNRLDEVLNPAVQIRSGAGELPMRGRVSLQAVISDWDLTQQKTLLPETARQLAGLRTRVASSLVYLVDDYRRVLSGYIYQRNMNVFVPMGKMIFEPRLDDVARDVIRQLNSLDQARQRLRPKPESPQSVATNTPVNN